MFDRNERDTLIAVIVDQQRRIESAKEDGRREVRDYERGERETLRGRIERKLYDTALLLDRGKDDDGTAFGVREARSVLFNLATEVRNGLAD